MHSTIAAALRILAVLLPAASVAAGNLPVTRANIIGTWAPEGASCDSDVVELYDANGDYGTDNEAGRWALKGSTLTVIVTRAGEMGEEFTPVRPPDRYVTTVLRLDRRFRVEKYADGSIHRARRCH